MANSYSHLSKEELLKIINKLESRKKYGLIWDEERTKEKFEKESENALPVLREIKSKEIMTDLSKPINILIEGDNYHALSVLNYTHQGKIDVIYIDPPYNTGAKDWKYNNAYVDKNDTWRHSKWLSFMSKRLWLAKRLLSEYGVLICTIDHNELNSLGILLSEIFPDKEITCVTIVHNPSGIQGINFSHNNEYAYFVHHKYRKVIEFEERADEDADIRQFMNTAKGNTDNYLREKGQNCFYPILIKDGEIIGFGEVCKKNFHPKSANVVIKKGIIKVYPIDNDGVERKWVFARQNVESIESELSIKYNQIRKKYEIIRTKKNINYKTVWIGNKFNAKTHGTQLLRSIIDKEFPFPKSLYAVCECIKAVIHSKNSIILDFFAGSGTTAHAVLEINKQDNGNRSFIICTNNENGICEEICYPRVENIIKGYKFTGKDRKVLYEKKITVSVLKEGDRLKNEIEAVYEHNQDNFDEIKSEIEDNYLRIYGMKDVKGDSKGFGGNLKYFKTTFVKKSISRDTLKIRITQECTEMLCLREGIFNEKKRAKDYRIFEQNDRIMAVYYSLERDELKSLKKELDKMQGDKILYCFTLDPMGLDKADFRDWKSVSLEPIPQKILDVYEGIYEY